MVVVTALFTGRVLNGFYNNICHTKADDPQGIPQASHEDHVAHIPYPFKLKRKHYISSLPLKRQFTPLSGLVPFPVEISVNNGMKMQSG